MSEQKTATAQITITFSDDKIKPGDVFYFTQHDGTPTLRLAKEGEDWNGWSVSNTGENPYHKVEKIEGVVISPAMIVGDLSRISGASETPVTA